MRYGRNKSRLSRIEFLKLSNIFEQNDISFFHDGNTVFIRHRNLHVFYLEKALFIVCIYFERFFLGRRTLLFFFLLVEHSPYQATQ